MSTPRFRIAIADSEAAQPPDTRVVLRQRMGWVLLLGAFLALLCLPPYRRMMTTQAQQALLQRAPTWMHWDPDSAAHRRRLQGALRRSERDLHVQSGAVLAGAVKPGTVDSAGRPVESRDQYLRNGVFDPSGWKDPRLEHLETLRRRAPEDPVLIAHMLRYYTNAQLLIRREETDSAVRMDQQVLESRLAPVTVQRLVELAREGARLDPENGFFPSLEAVAYFAGGEDVRGLEALHRASLCRTWRDYSMREGEAARDLLIRGYGDHGFWMRVTPSAAVLLPHLAQVRIAARAALVRADEARRAGDLRREHSIRTDLIRLGGTIRRDADTLISRLVGNAVSALGFQGRTAEWHGRSGQSADDEHERRLQEYGRYVEQLRAEAPDLADSAARELETMRRYPARQEALEAGSAWDRLVPPVLVRETAGLTLLLNLAASLLLWTGAALALAVLKESRRNAALSARSRWSWFWNDAPPALRIGGLVLLPLVMATSVVGLQAGAPLGYAATAAAAIAVTALLLGRGFPSVPRTHTHAALMTGAALCGAAGSVAALAQAQPLQDYWQHAHPAASLLIGDGHRAERGVLWLMSLLPLWIIGVSLVAVLARRASFRGLLQAVRLTARGAGGVLAGGYLAYLLWAVPAEVRDTRTFERMLARETAGSPHWHSP